jgi:hypothetical protein
MLGRKADVEGMIPGRRMDAERDRIREKYAREEASIAKQLRDPNLEGDLRLQLKKVLETLPGAMRDELRNIAPPQSRNQSTFDSQLRTTGAGDAQARKLDDMVKHLDGIKAHLAAIKEAVRVATMRGSASGPQVAR